MTLEEWTRIAEAALPRCTEQGCPYLGSNRVYGCECAREMDRALERLANPSLHLAALKVIECAKVLNETDEFSAQQAFVAALAELEAL